MKNLDLPTITEKLTSIGSQIGHFIGRYRTILTIGVACAAIFAAVAQTQGYLNPSRDETTYGEIKTQVNVKNIDPEIVTKLEATQSDRTDSVDSEFVPGRNNPFDE